MHVDVSYSLVVGAWVAVRWHLVSSAHLGLSSRYAVAGCYTDSFFCPAVAGCSFRALQQQVGMF